MVYNVTGIASGNSTGMLTLIQGVNTELMGGWLGVLFMLGFGAVIFTSIIFKTEDFSKAIITTMFTMFSLSMPLVALELLSPLAIFITLIGAAVAIAFSWKSG